MLHKNMCGNVTFRHEQWKGHLKRRKFGLQNKVFKEFLKFESFFSSLFLSHVENFKVFCLYYLRHGIMFDCETILKTWFRSFQKVTPKLASVCFQRFFLMISFQIFLHFSRRRRIKGRKLFCYCLCQWFSTIVSQVFSGVAK